MTGYLDGPALDLRVSNWEPQLEETPRKSSGAALRLMAARASQARLLRLRMVAPTAGFSLTVANGRLVPHSTVTKLIRLRWEDALPRQDNSAVRACLSLVAHGCAGGHGRLVRWLGIYSWVFKS